MATLRLLVVASIIPAIAVLIGALLGMPSGADMSFVLASVVGTIGVLVMVPIAQRRRVLHPERGRGAAIGGLVGMALGISLAATAPDQVAFLAGGTLMTGIGTWAGSGGGAIK